MKVSDLTGAKLDYWVAKAQYDDGREIILHHYSIYTHSVAVSKTKESGSGYMRFAPSEDWAHGGPIIEREGISVSRIAIRDQPVIWQADFDYRYERGEAPLIAAMRCYVASKFGEQVPD